METGIFKDLLIAGVPVIGTVIGWLFLRRRLFAVIRVYTRSALSNNGKSVLVTILNRGHRPESDIRFEFDPSRVYALLAASSDDIKLTNNQLEVGRLPARSTVEAVFLVEGGDFDKENAVRLTSKEGTEGKTFRKLEDVPPVTGAVPLFAGFLMILAIAPATFIYFMDQDFSNSREDFSPQQLKLRTKLADIGWGGNLDDFVKSSIAKDYEGPADFPVTATAYRRISDFVVLTIRMRNRTAEWMATTVNLKTPSEIDVTDCRRGLVQNYIGDSMVLPHQEKSAVMVAYVPENASKDAQVVRVSVTIATQKAHVYEVTRLIDVSEIRVEPLNSVTPSTEPPGCRKPQFPPVPPSK